MRKKDRSVVRDKRRRAWTVTVTTIEEDDDLAPWLDLTPAERVELIGECVLDGLELRGKCDVPRLRRVRIAPSPAATRDLGPTPIA